MFQANFHPAAWFSDPDESMMISARSRIYADPTKVVNHIMMVHISGRWCSSVASKIVRIKQLFQTGLLTTVFAVDLHQDLRYHDDGVFGIERLADLDPKRYDSTSRGVWRIGEGWSIGKPRLRVAPRRERS